MVSNEDGTTNSWDIIGFYLIFLNYLSKSVDGRQQPAIDWQYWTQNNLPTLYALKNVENRERIKQVLVSRTFVESVCVHFAHSDAFEFYTSKHLAALDAMCGSKGPKAAGESTATTHVLQKINRPTATITNVADSQFINIDVGGLHDIITNPTPTKRGFRTGVF